MADRHYVAIEPQALFDEAVLWLGQQLGQVKSRPATVSLASPGSAKVSPTMRSATGSTAGALPSGLGSGTTASGETWGSSSR